jgi:hypothetical protein
MIGFFPELYPDELLFSACSRYAEATGYETLKAAAMDLFESDRIRLSMDFPANLAKLVGSLPPGHHFTTSRLIDQHTLLPFFAPFMSAERVAGIRRNMELSGAARIHGATGINRFKNKLRVFRYCPGCVLADREKFGEAYWHRIHHIPSVDLCPLHRLYLTETELPLRSMARNSARIFATAEASIGDSNLDCKEEDDERLRELQTALAHNVRWLLENVRFAGYQQNHRDHYVHLLYERGFCTYGGVLDRQKLANELTAYYSHDFLVKLRCEVRTDGAEDWVNRFVHRKERAIHPFHHLLMLQFLGESVEGFLNASDYERPSLGQDCGPEEDRSTVTIPPFVDPPFGFAPWPCLNRTAEHFQQNVITICELKTAQHYPRRPRGIFRCDCGFAYSRVGPDKSESDRQKLDWYISFGEQWDKTLCELLEQGEGYDSIKLRMGVGTRTLAKQIIRLGRRSSGGRDLSWAMKPRNRTLKARDGRKISAHDLKQRRATNRRKFLDATKANPELGRTQLRKQFAAPYSWLYQHDRRWLEKHLPIRSYLRKLKARTNWSKKDAELAVAVRIEAESMRALPGRPVIISRTAITRSLGMAYLSKNPAAKLPLMNIALSEVAETREQFAVRRVEWATSVFRAQGLSPASWRIALLARLSGDAAKALVVKAALDNAVVLLKSQMELNYHEANAA